MNATHGSDLATAGVPSNLAPLPSLEDVGAYASEHPVGTAFVCVLGLVVLVLAYLVLRKTLRAAADFYLRVIAPRPAAKILTVVAASIATGVSAQGMWRFSGDVLGLDGPLRLLLFAFIEVAIITSAVRASQNMRENYSAGVDGIAVWALTVLTAILSSMDARSLAEAIFRLAAPLVAAWLWERGMAIERHRLTGRGRINWRLTPERMMVRLGLAEAADRTASAVDIHRRLNRVALAVIGVDAAVRSSARKQRAADGRLRVRIAEAVEHTGLATEPELQKTLLDLIDALRSGKALAARQAVARWADPVTPQAKASADAALAELLRFDSREATQRAIDRTALTLMALVESTPPPVPVVAEHVTAMVTERPARASDSGPPGPPAVTAQVTPPVTSVVVAEQVAPSVTFDVTDLAVYDASRVIDVHPEVTSSATSPDVTEEVAPEPDEPSKTQLMGELWERERAEGRYPSVTELAEQAGAHHALASRLRKGWVAELPLRERRKADPKRERASA